MKTVTERSYAKINLYLDVVGKREDGYHDIESVMQTVSLYDTVKITVTDSDIKMTCTDGTLSCGDDNLCIRAARLFLSTAKINSGVFIELEKNIPMQAGLGGGSADAAAVLRGMNRLFDMPFREDELREIGKRLGADVPFCVSGGTALARGIGEILTPLDKIPRFYIVITSGEGKSQTPLAYKAIDMTPPSKKGDVSGILNAISRSDKDGILSCLYNRFEDVIPGIDAVKQILYSSSAEGVLMSGSGTAVFGMFSSDDKAKKACDALTEAGHVAFLCETV